MIRAHCLAKNVTLVRLEDFLVSQGQELTIGLNHYLLVRMSMLLRVDPIMGRPLLLSYIWLLRSNCLERLDLVVVAVCDSN